MKIKLLLIMFLCMTIFLVGCTRGKPYEYQCQSDMICEIEIVYARTVTDYDVLKTLSYEESSEFMKEFEQLNFNKYIFGTPMEVCDAKAIKIEYESGLYEIISSYATGYIDNLNYYGLTSQFCVDKDAFDALLEKYLETKAI